MLLDDLNFTTECGQAKTRSEEFWKHAHLYNVGQFLYTVLKSEWFRFVNSCSLKTLVIATTGIESRVLTNSTIILLN